MAVSVLQLAGLACIAYLVLKIVRSVLKTLYTYAIGPALFKLDFKSKGKWALVTGCTDGIGKEYARQLAARGCDIVLVSRSIDKLKATAQEIEKEFNVSTKIIQVDFCGGDEIYSTIEKEIAGLEIGTLVNNVGVSYSYPEYFLDIPDGDNLIQTLLKANVVSVTRMTRLVLPQMVQRKKGVLINIGSLSTDIPCPMLSVYAATKAYVDKFTEGLEMEYGKKGIIIQCVLPGFVCSNMSGIRKSTLLAPSAKVFVNSAIDLVGIARKTTGYFPHVIFGNVLMSIQGMCYSFCVWLVTRSMENSRLKSLKKYKKQKGKMEA
ncbi:very-long-chain 3-oxoacyl-CoA reductase isoform X1 [Helicoverpa armigera]|uniref:very-long-chain 3-oxoacyl-CoA reductase isoform X1 n=2 Tax=Helicoverpa armigera TaxID=29058 RepID=UPI0030831F93